MNRFIIYFVITTIPLLFAAVQPWAWSFYATAFFTAFLVTFWKNSFATGRASDKFFKISIFFFFFITLLQSLPLPRQILHYISPYRYDVLVQAHALTDLTLSWQAVSYSSRDSIAWWAFLLSLFLFVSVLRKYCTSRYNLTCLIRILAFVATLEALYGLIQALVPKIGVLWIDSAYPGCACGTYINRNHFAGFIEILWPLLLGYTLSIGDDTGVTGFSKIFSSDRLNIQLLYTLAIIIMLLALLFSKSRGGIIGGIIGIVSFLWLVRSGYRSHSIIFRLLIGVIISFLCIYSIKIGFGPIVERFMTISGGDARLDMWKDGLAILKDHPFGIGLGNTPKVLPVYQIAYTADLNAIHLHNDYLQLLVETGFPGFWAIVSGGFVFLWKSILRVKKLTSHQDAFRYFIAVGALSGLISIIVHSFFDFNLQIPANCFYFVMLIGIVYACLWRGSFDEKITVS
ncbi:O-antigen ligase family protein [Desulfococcaceae bacterium HSG9]|nr:O-antigen ligase family protein [Desulfococcaceae bacterium HSG9]